MPGQGTRFGKPILDEAFIIEQRNLMRAELAAQGERICSDFERLKDCLSSEDFSIQISIVGDQVEKFRRIQSGLHCTKEAPCG